MFNKASGLAMIAIIAAAALGLLVQQAVKQAESRPMPEQAIAGKELFQRQACIECHTIFGNGGYSGGDLTKVYVKYGASLPDVLTADRPLASYAQKRHVRLTPAEAQAVTAYLQYIDSTNNLDWPPPTILK